MQDSKKLLAKMGLKAVKLRFPHEKLGVDGHTMKHNAKFYEQLSKEQVQMFNGIQETF